VKFLGTLVSDDGWCEPAGFAGEDASHADEVPGAHRSTRRTRCRWAWRSLGIRPTTLGTVAADAGTTACCAWW